MSIPYTTATARAQVRVLLNETTSTGKFWTNTELDNYLKLSTEDVSTKSHCVEDTFGFALKTGVREYTSASTATAALTAVETDVLISTATFAQLSSTATATWVTDGFKAPMRITLSQTASNEGDVTIRNVSDEKTMTLYDGISYESTGTVTLTHIYSWIANITKIYGMSYRKGSTGTISYKGLTRIHPQSIRKLAATTDSEPQYWYHFGDTIGVYPIPASAQEGDCIVVHHSKLTDNITQLPDEYQVFAILKATGKARLKEGNFAEAIQYESLYTNSLMFHRGDLYNRGVDSDDMFQIPEV